MHGRCPSVSSVRVLVRVYPIHIVSGAAQDKGSISQGAEQPNNFLSALWVANPYVRKFALENHVVLRV